MPLYQQDLVDLSAKTRVLLLLVQSDSRSVVSHTLDEVFWNLLTQSYPLEETYQWVSNGGNTPEDLHQQKDRFYDQRRLCYWFWKELCEHDYGPPQQRSSNGSRTEHLMENIIAELTV